jgi:hypothetical protein
MLTSFTRERVQEEVGRVRLAVHNIHKHSYGVRVESIDDSLRARTHVFRLAAFHSKVLSHEGGSHVRGALLDGRATKNLKRSDSATASARVMLMSPAGDAALVNKVEAFTGELREGGGERVLEELVSARVGGAQGGGAVDGVLEGVGAVEEGQAAIEAGRAGRR